MPSIPHRIPASIIADKKDFLAGRMINVIDSHGAQFYGRFLSADSGKLVMKDARNYIHRFQISDLAEVVTDEKVPIS